MKKGIAIVIGVAIVLVVAGVASGLSTDSDKETGELINTEPETGELINTEPEITPENAEAPAGKDLRIDLSETVGVRGQ